MNADDRAAIEARHQPAKDNPKFCVSCHDTWPCDARRLLDELCCSGFQDGWSEGVDKERARIIEAVKGLPPDDFWIERDVVYVRETAVLAMVEGKDEPR